MKVETPTLLKLMQGKKKGGNIYMQGIVTYLRGK
jgi:hypothetical protein